MGKVCDRCEALYVRLSNAGSGVLADPWAAVWRDSVAACGCRDRRPGSWYVVHSGTDTVLAASECQVVDLQSEGVQLAIDHGLTGDDYRDDLTVIDAADSFGLSLFDILNGTRVSMFSASARSWYVVNLETGESVPALGGLVAVDFDALDKSDRDIFETGTDFDVAALAARVGFTLDVMLGGQ